MKKILVVVLLLAALAAGGLWFYFFEKEPLMSLKYPDEAEAVITHQTDENAGSEQAENAATAEIIQIETFTAKQNAAKAHEKYLNDSLTFKAFSQNIEINRSTAVVASDTCQFFEIESINSPEDLKLLKDGIKIPAGTILTITGGAFRNVHAPSEDNGTFTFEKIKNWFYPVEYAGKSGIVFAGDLRGIDAPAEVNEILSMRYSQSAQNAARTAELDEGWLPVDGLKNYQKFSQFYPFCGTTPLDGDLQKLLQKDKVAFKSVSSIEYTNILNAAQTPVLDPLLELYLSHYDLNTQKTESALFFTTDLFAHFEELLYQKTLLSLQEKGFLPQILLLCDAFIEQLNGESENIVDKAESITETGHDAITIIVPDEITQKALLYFQTGRALGECINAESANLLFNRKSTATAQKTRQSEVAAALDVILEKYPEAVRQEVFNILRAEGTEKSPVFTFADGTSYRIDYSAFAVPQKYSTSASLAAYYRINKWFSSIKFPVAEEKLLNTQKDFNNFSDEQKLAFKMAPVALYISNLAFNSQPLMEKWQLLYAAQNALAGDGLNLSFAEIAPVYSAKSEQSAKIWLSKPANIAEFALNASRKCTSPVLGNLQNDFKLYTPEQNAGNAENIQNEVGEQEIDYSEVLFAASFANAVNPCWALFADNYEIEQWFYKTLAHVLPASEQQPVLREKIELLAALDCAFAEKNTSNKSEIEVLAKCFAAQNDDFWNKNYHALTLKQTKALANFEPGSKFYFTESSAWGKRTLQSAAGFNAQSQHLPAVGFYTPKSAENSAGFAGQFRTRPLPQMVSYLEPNVEFFTAARQATAYLHAVLEAFNFGGDHARLLNAVAGFENLLENAQRVAKIEVQNQPLDEKDLNWLESIPFELKEMLAIYKSSGETEPDAGNVLYFEPSLCRPLVQNSAYAETARLSALGIPGRLYVALNDEQGGKRIACGYAFNYYEFAANARSGDFAENWQTQVQNGGSLENYKPDYLK